MTSTICPNCKELLSKNERVLICKNGHSFDLSKEGYVNLLLPNQKNNSNPGDNKLMMIAREEFLSTTHYDFLCHAIENNLHNEFNKGIEDKIKVLDLGCGTGYYTRKLFSQQSKTIEKIGIDISKAGIAKASKKDKEGFYIVSSIYNIPLLDNSFDIVLNIFSPIDIKEAFRVLSPGGILIKVIPDKNHMKEIAKKIYDVVIPHQSTFIEIIEQHEGLKVLNSISLERVISFTKNETQNLISMTPYLYKFQKENLQLIEGMDITIAFKIIMVKYVQS